MIIAPNLINYLEGVCVGGGGVEHNAVKASPPLSSLSTARRLAKVWWASCFVMIIAPNLINCLEGVCVGGGGGGGGVEHNAVKAKTPTEFTVDCKEAGKGMVAFLHL